ncbi:MAG TPA: ribonuclease P protein component [Aggregatilineales bacterium]|nr:ribonuclease P protein component [Anaerolineales bacterium]HRE47980.1 ribonuclease P protein component [Aggregatilineales bacterium]
MRRDLRLRRAADFAHLRSVGKTIRGTFFTLAYTPNGLPHNRYGVITGKRIGGAVIRNRVKRRLREALRLLDDHLVVGYDVVLIARSEMRSTSFSALEMSLLLLVGKAGLRRESSNQPVQENTP